MSAPVFTFDPNISFTDPNTLVLSGTASGDFTKVDITTNDAAKTDLGSPQVTDGHWTLNVKLDGLSGQSGFTLAATDALANVTDFNSNFVILPDVKNEPYTTVEVSFGGGSLEHVDLFNKSGDMAYHGDVKDLGGGSFQFTETGDALRTTFVFVDGPDTVLQTITNFHATGAGHDTISLPPSDFTSLADVLRNTTMSNGNATIHDPNNANASLTLMGVTKAELKSHPHDFSFHGTGQLT